MVRTMKDSGIEWIGEIPENWKLKKLKYDNLVIMGQSPSSDEYNLDGTGFPFLQGNADFTNIYPNARVYTSSASKFSNTNDILFSVRAPVGEKNISNKQYAIGRGLCAIRAINSKMKYLWHYTEVLKDEFRMISTGSTFESVSVSDIKNSIFLAPSLSEQEKIAAFLDEKCGAIDEIISKTEQSIEEYKKLKQSVITKAVTKGIRPNRPMQDSNIEWIGEIPENWNVRKTLHCLSMPITDGPHTTPQFFEDGIPFISAESVSFGKGKIDLSHARGYISDEFYKECCLKYVPKINDLLMIKSGATTGRVSIVDIEKKFTIWSPLAVFRVNPSMLFYKFLFYFIQSQNYQKQLEDNWSFGTQQNIGMRVLEQLKIVLPPLDEQKEIADYLDEKCAEIDTLVEKKQQFLAEMANYKKSLIYEYVTGKKEVA